MAERIISLENHFPSDILPTARFISRLPGIDQKYSGIIGKGEVFWNGTAVVHGEQINIRISHVNQDTTFLLENKNRAELWEIEEHSCMQIIFRRRRAVLPGTVLNPSSSIEISESRYAVRLNFCDGREWTMIGEHCEKCPFRGKELVKKGRGHEEHYATDTCNDVAYFEFSRPSDLPVRKVRDIHLEMSEKSLVGFESVQEAIDTLVALRNTINNATPFLSSESAPIPSSSSLISDRYFG